VSVASRGNSHEPLTARILGGSYADPQPPRLCHFTNPHALHGILSDGAVRATHIAYTNDRAELRQLIREFVKVLRREIYPGNTANGEPLMPRIAIVLDQYIVGSEHTFIACFSQTDPSQDLGQWRAYAARGYCIELSGPLHERFDFADLQWQLGPCKYGRERETIASILQDINQDELVRDLQELDRSITLDRSKDFALNDKAGASMVADELRRIMAPLRPPLMAVAPFCKSAAFATEKEWRLVIRTENLAVPIKLRVGQKTLVPYIELNLIRPRGRFPGMVWIGPELDQDLAEQALALMHVQAQPVNFSFRGDV
jgi:hypothetical protein